MNKNDGFKGGFKEGAKTGVFIGPFVAFIILFIERNHYILSGITFMLLIIFMIYRYGVYKRNIDKEKQDVRFNK